MIEFPSRERFEQWLLRQPQDKVLADNWHSGNCPLCLLLKDHGVEHPAVRGYGEWSHNRLAGVQQRALPAWAKAFVYWVDKIKPRRVTAEDCLFVLGLPYFNVERKEI